MTNNEIIRKAKVGLEGYALELQRCGYTTRSIQDSLICLAMTVALEYQEMYSE